MKLADRISVLILALIVIMFLALLTPISAKEPNSVIQAKCWGEVNNKYCKIRTKDNKIYWDGKWREGYYISHVVETEQGFQLMSIKDK